MNKSRAALIAFVIGAVLLLAPYSALAIDLGAPLPVEVINDNGWGTIKKIYELPKDEDRTKIPIADLVVGGVTYKCSDVLMAEVALADSKEYSEVYSVESKTNDDATVSSLLPPERDIRTDDGYAGTLKLEPATVKAESTGTITSSRVVTVSREYPNQASMDIDLLPKTIKDNGRDYTLGDVRWSEDSTYNGDDLEIGTRYTAYVTYQRDAVSTSDKGFTVTATYSGTVERGKDALIRYTVIFTRSDGVGLIQGDDGGFGATDQSGGGAVTASPPPAPETAVPGEVKAPGISGPNRAVIIVLCALILLVAVSLVLIKTGVLRFGRQDNWNNPGSSGGDNNANFPGV